MGTLEFGRVVKANVAVFGLAPIYNAVAVT